MKMPFMKPDGSMVESRLTGSSDLGLFFMLSIRFGDYLHVGVVFIQPP
jgi:hypothetical protein